MVTNVDIDTKSKVDSRDSQSGWDYSELDNDFIEEDEWNLKEVKKSYDFKGPSVIKEQIEEDDEKMIEKKTEHKFTIYSGSKFD